MTLGAKQPTERTLNSALGKCSTHLAIERLGDDTYHCVACHAILSSEEIEAWRVEQVVA